MCNIVGIRRYFFKPGITMLFDGISMYLSSYLFLS